ncbi:uncharacterized protein METZ01_LOCUS324617, partial [marine metagenome]
NEPMPYSRGTIWSRAVRNLADAGAKVVVLDLMFDKPDHQTENIKNYIKEQNVEGIDIKEGDKLLVEAINYAASKGTKVILSGSRKVEPSRIPPDYLLEPTEELNYNGNKQKFGLIDVNTDIDGFYRKYGIFYPISGHESVYYTLGINAVLSYYNIDKKPVWKGDSKTGEVTIGPLTIPSYGNINTFLLNYSGPSSGEYKTFNRFSLSNIVDTKDYNVGESEYDLDFGEMVYFEDQDWMDKYIDPFMAPIFEAQGFVNPFRGKIIVIGTSLSEDQDIKPTPFLTYGENDHLMPGLEIHANAIQQMLKSDYIKSPFGTLEYDSRYNKEHLLIIFIWVLNIVCISPC